MSATVDMYTVAVAQRVVIHALLPFVSKTEKVTTHGSPAFYKEKKTAVCRHASVADSACNGGA